MLKVAIRLLLAVQLAACPAVCWTLADDVATSDPTTAKASPVCSDCCEAPADGEDSMPQNPAPPRDCPCKSKGYSCVCSGAVIEVTDSARSVAMQPFARLVPAEPIESNAAATPVVSVGNETVSAPNGRALRALICSLLC